MSAPWLLDRSHYQHTMLVIVSVTGAANEVIVAVNASVIAEVITSVNVVGA